MVNPHPRAYTMLTVHHTRAHAALTGSVASFRSYESLGTNEARLRVRWVELAMVWFPNYREYTLVCVDVLVLVVLMGGLD